MSLISNKSANIASAGIRVDPAGYKVDPTVPFAGGKSNDGRSIIRAGQEQRIDGFRKRLTAPVKRLGGSVINNGGYFDFELEAGSCSYITNVIAELTINNATGAATTLVPAPYLIDKIEVRANGNSIVVANILDDELHFNTSQYTPTQWAIMAPKLNMTTGWANGAAIANGATVKYRIPFLGTVIDQVKPAILALSSDLVLRFYLKPFTMTNAAAGAAPTLTDANLQYDVVVLDEYALKVKETEYAALPHREQYFDSHILQDATKTFTAGQTADINLTELKGRTGQTVLSIRPVGATGTNLYAFVDLSGWLIDLTTGQGPSGNSLIGGAKLGSELRELFVMDYDNTGFVAGVNMFPIIWSLNPLSDAKDGTCNGYMVFNEDVWLRLTPPAGYGPTAGEVHVMNWFWKEQTISTDGKISSNE